MTAAQEAIARLDASLAEHGTGEITLSRGAATVTVNARCRAVRADELISRSSGAQIVYRGIISATGLEPLGSSLRRGDKVFYNGAERSVLWADPVPVGGVPVRFNFEFAG